VVGTDQVRATRFSPMLPKPPDGYGGRLTSA